MTKLEQEALDLFNGQRPIGSGVAKDFSHLSDEVQAKYMNLVLGAVEDKTDTMGNNEGNVEDTLKQRGNIYGSYEKVCSTRCSIMELLDKHHLQVNSKRMDEVTKIAFGDLVLKLVRAAGAPEYKDSFHDLGGYAKLMEDMIDA